MDRAGQGQSVAITHNIRNSASRQRGCECRKAMWGAAYGQRFLVLSSPGDGGDLGCEAVDNRTGPRASRSAGAEFPRKARADGGRRVAVRARRKRAAKPRKGFGMVEFVLDRKSTRLNSSHANIPYAVFCLKTKLTAYTSASAVNAVSL